VAAAVAPLEESQRVAIKADRAVPRLPRGSPSGAPTRARTGLSSICCGPKRRRGCPLRSRASPSRRS
jgi:hypothetical protein